MTIASPESSTSRYLRAYVMKRGAAAPELPLTASKGSPRYACDRTRVTSRCTTARRRWRATAERPRPVLEPARVAACST
ncbi:hypothetical protein DF030_23070 [Burkholderia cenocepacia]|nr:hypothetical protein DF030_23070 [Burkholderia cenocepacia]